MGVEAHRLLLLRHGETEWSKSRQHTSRTDLDLTENGQHQAKVTAEALTELKLKTPMVISSPRRRALVTAELAGLAVDEVSPLLAEWDYGEYEGLTTPEIRKSVPGWQLWRDGCPGGADGTSSEQACGTAGQGFSPATTHHRRPVGGRLRKLSRFGSR